MRKIYCEECGKMKLPTHPDDAALGYFPRRTHGQVRNELVCDGCGKTMLQGSNAVAESIPRDMGFWEDEYLTVESQKAITKFPHLKPTETKLVDAP